MADTREQTRRRRAEARERRRSLLTQPFEELDAKAESAAEEVGLGEPGEISPVAKTAAAAAAAALAGGLAGAAKAMIQRRREADGDEPEQSAGDAGPGDESADPEADAAETGEAAGEPSAEGGDDDRPAAGAGEEHPDDAGEEDDDEPAAAAGTADEQPDDDDEPAAAAETADEQPDDDDEPAAAAETADEQPDDEHPRADAETEDEQPAEDDEPRPEAGGDDEPAAEGEEGATAEAGDEPAAEGGKNGARGASESGEDGDAPQEGVAASDLKRVIQSAQQQLEELVGTEVESVSSFERTDDGWRVSLEVVEMRRVPDSTDVLSSYDVVLDADDGNVVSLERTRRYRRSQVDSE